MTPEERRKAEEDRMCDDLVNLLWRIRAATRGESPIQPKEAR